MSLKEHIFHFFYCMIDESYLTRLKKHPVYSIVFYSISYLSFTSPWTVLALVDLMQSMPLPSPPSTIASESPYFSPKIHTTMIKYIVLHVYLQKMI